VTGIVAAFTMTPAPWGPLHVAATAAGIVAVDLGSETPDFVDGLARRLHGRVLPAEDGEVPAELRTTLNAAAGQIGEWFAGRRTAFELPIDLRVSDWDRLVLTGAGRLRYGETVGYGELARRVGEDADPHAGVLQAAQLRARLRPRSEVHGPAFGGEPLEQRPPVAEPLVEQRRGGHPVLRQVELDARPARHVLEPVAPEWARVREHGVEIDCESVHRTRC